ncbi:DUF4446 family protein [Patescibacteria group bacterium]
MNFITANPSFFYLSIAIALIILWNVFLHLRLFQIKKKLKIFFNGKKASDLESVLFEAIKRIRKSENDTDKIFKSLKILQELTTKSIKKVSVVRFNPFQNTGSNQSFSIAMLDSRNNGLIISSLYTREGTRIYSKPILNGESEYQLSKEEIKALEKIGIKSKNA